MTVGYDGETPRARAFRLYPEAAAVVSEVLSGAKVCAEGERIAWFGAAVVQRALDKARETEKTTEREIERRTVAKVVNALAGKVNSGAIELVLGAIE